LVSIYQRYIENFSDCAALSLFLTLADYPQTS
jgi:hypothetical protein